MKNIRTSVSYLIISLLFAGCTETTFQSVTGPSTGSIVGTNPELEFETNDLVRLQASVCVKTNHDGTFEARFGYTNENPTLLVLPKSPNNQFLPDVAEPPSQFNVGEHLNVVRLGFTSGQRLEWRLGVGGVVASESTPQCPSDDEGHENEVPAPEPSATPTPNDGSESNRYLNFNLQWFDVLAQPSWLPLAPTEGYHIVIRSGQKTATCSYQGQNFVCLYPENAEGLIIDVGSFYSIEHKNVPKDFQPFNEAPSYEVLSNQGFCTWNNAVCTHTIILSAICK